MASDTQIAAELKNIQDALQRLQAAIAGGKPILAEDAPAVPAPRTLVYVHGICLHTAGFSNDWWQSLHPFTTVFGPGTLNDTRREVVWSDIIHQNALVRTAAMAPSAAASHTLDRIDLAAQIRGAIQERITTQAAAGGPSAVAPEVLPATVAADPMAALGLSIPLPFCIDDFTSYMLNEDVRTQIIGRFTGVVGPLLAAGGSVDIISHSWGTVVAYEGLRQLEDSGTRNPTVGNLFTVGAALSIGPVKLSLRPQNRNGHKPAMVRRWINLNAHGDPVGGDIQGHPFQVDAQFLDLPNLGCGFLDISCAHGSYFKSNNVKVNRDIFAGFINGT